MVKTWGLFAKLELLFSKNINLVLKGMFGSCFLKRFLRTVFENIENENCSYYPNLVFYVFFIKKKKKKKLGIK